MNKEQSKNATWSQKKLEMRKAEAKIIRVFPKSLGMKKDDFIEEMAKELHYHPDTVATYLKRGFSDERSPAEMCTALQNIYEHFISDENISKEDREFATIGYKTIGIHIIELINKAENRFLKSVEPFKYFFTDKHRKYRAITGFIGGFWPEPGEGLTAEEAALLREALFEFPPKGIKHPNLKKEERQP